MPAVTLADVEAARERHAATGAVRETPCERNRTLSAMLDADVHPKMEHLQRTGSFKPRGAYNAIRQLADAGDAERVVAASAGNHAQGVAIAATEVGLPSTVVMPESAPQAKIDATEGYGAEVVLHGTDFQAAMAEAKALAGTPGTELVHAFDDPEVVAGQGTLGLEIAEQCPDVDTVVVPVGGGGLIGGVGVALADRAPDARLVAVQTDAAATLPESLAKGAPVDLADPDTIADGIATGHVSELTYGLVEAHVDEVVTVSDDEIASSSLVLFERTKQIVEGAGAASVAALFGDELDVTGETVVPVLSGGNIDMSMLKDVLTFALADRDQLIHLRVRIDDVPGTMEALAGLIAEHGANIRTVRHDRAVGGLHVAEAYLLFEVITGGAGHSKAVIEHIADAGYDVERVN
ncbi:MAG: threonine ammonia-lyase [Halobacteriales archaeon]|nr:threonine ammonia-lyase [Halobacteriales archaeon]